MASLIHLFRVSSSSSYAALLAALILAAPATFALTTEQHRRAPESTTMAFSPLAITGYALLAIAASYVLLRLYQHLKTHLPSTAKESLPQPVSAGRTSSLSLFSPFSLLRTRPKLVKTTSTWSRWSPLPALIRRFTRPSSPLHLSGMELLPTTMPNSPPDNTHSLIDLPLMTGSFPVSKGQMSKHSRFLSRSSSMDALPSYRPLTPVPVLVPVPIRTAPLAPSTPPPPSPPPIPGTNGSDTPLASFTLPKPQPVPTATTSPSGLPSPPLTGTFPAITLSPSKPSGTMTSTTTVVGSRPGSPSPSLFLSSHTISSLSLSPRSLNQQQHRRSKSLGGVTVKRISPPCFDWDEACTQDVADSEAGLEHHSRAHTLVVPALENQAKEKVHSMQNRSSLTLSNEPSKFLLNFSSSSSSSGSGLSMGSPSQLTSNSGSTPASAPLLTPRTFSSSSHSSDIAKFSEQVPPFPNPIPLVDVDTNINTDIVQGFTGNNEKVNGWSFDVDEPMEVGVAVEQVLLDLDMSTPAPPVHVKASPEYLGSSTNEKEDQKLIETEDGNAKVELEQPEEDKWEWDSGLESQDGYWGTEPQTETLLTLQSDIWNSAEPVTEGSHALSSPPAARANMETLPALEAEGSLQHPDPDLLPLPDFVDVLPSATLAKVTNLPTITISTQDAILCKKDLDEPDITHTSSKGTSTPVVQAQTPTPPASPPREMRMSPLPKADGGSGWGHDGLSPGGSIVSSPVMGKSPIMLDVEAQQEVLVVVTAPAVGEEDLISPEGDQPDEGETAELDEVDAEEVIVAVLDKGLVCSPASMSSTLSESDTLSDAGSIAGSTFDVEIAVDRDEDGVFGVRCEVVPASPSVKVPCWDYGYDENEVSGQEELAMSEEATDAKDPGVVGAEPELPSEALPQPEEQVPVSECELQPCSIPPAPVPNPAPEPITSLPEIALASTPEIKPQTQAPSLPREIRQRKRTALEEAVERTRSPLEVALAMQLRPGLGVGADPAWMVRFLMVMWGWMFGMVLVPSA